MTATDSYKILKKKYNRFIKASNTVFFLQFLKTSTGYKIVSG